MTKQKINQNDFLDELESVENKMEANFYGKLEKELENVKASLDTRINKIIGKDAKKIWTQPTVKEIDFRVITLYQPWATLLAHGIKKNETRPKPTSHTCVSSGNFMTDGQENWYLIHAAKKWNREQKDLCYEDHFYDNLESLGYILDVPNSHIGTKYIDLPLGCIIGAFQVDECLVSGGILKDQQGIANVHYSNGKIAGNIFPTEVKFGDYSVGRSIWIGKNHKLLEAPIPYKGSQGYYSRYKGDVSLLKFKP